MNDQGVEQLCINTIRTLSIDAVRQARNPDTLAHLSLWLLWFTLSGTGS